MKLIILLLPVLLCGFINIAIGQHNIQFIYIGGYSGNDQSVVLTSVKDLKMNDVEILLIDHRTLDTLRAYILRNYMEWRTRVAPPINTTTDTLNALGGIKVIGVDLNPLYFSKDAFSELVFSAMRYLRTVDLNHSTVNFVLLHLKYLGQERFLHRDVVDSSAHADPYLRLKNDSNK
jgi:hypothetical protein